MGTVYSRLVRTIKSFRAAISVLRGLSDDFEALQARTHAAPGLPVALPTAPYWLEDPPFPELVDVQSPELPATADVAIIGSGIAAAATARSLLRQRAAMSNRTGSKAPVRVVVLEARSLCSGATGRNGGHIKATPQEIFRRLRKRVGPQRAAALCRFQLRHLDVLTGLCAAEGIDVAECREVETVDLFIDAETFRMNAAEVEELQEWIPEFTVRVWSATEAQERFQANHLVMGAITYRAGALWPYRFVTSIWKSLLDEFPESLAIETGTPVQSIDVGSSPGHPYHLTTSRGTIKAKHVVHATNAFVGQFVPGLRGKLTGCLAHMSAQRPGVRFADVNGSRSWSFMYSRGFDYVTQRPSANGAPGDVLLGGGLAQSPNQGADQIGIYDDSKVDVLVTSHVLGILSTLFEPSWGPEAAGGKPKAVWSGIIGLTADWCPLVGPLDPRITGRKVPLQGKAGHTREALDVPSEWIAAGFCGDGMVWAWLSGTALGLMIAGADKDDLPAEPGRPGGRLADWFPAELQPTCERVKAMDLTDLIDLLL